MSNNNSRPPSTQTSPDNSIEDLRAQDAANAANAAAPRPSAAILKRPAVNPSGTKSASGAASSNSSRASSPSQPLRASVTTSISTPTSPNNVLSGRSSMHMTPLSSNLPSPVASKPAPSDPPDTNEPLARVLRSTNPAKGDDGAQQQPVGLRSPVLGSRRNSSNSVKQSDGEANDPNPNTLASRLASYGENTSSEESSSRKPGAHGPNTSAKNPRGASGMAPRLETVQEGDPSTPPQGQTLTSPVKNASATISRPQDRASGDSTTAEGALEKLGDDQSKRQESTKNLMKGPSRKGSTSSLPQLKNRQQPNEGGSTKTMTVETETVASIPQAPTATAERSATGRSESSNILRSKTSNETIKPKKERKKPSKRPQVSGTTSKAELFEAKVTSAVDEDESDSDETFVYESNPLEPRHRRHHHSRTPSSNSVRSFADRRGGVRSMSQLEPQRAVTGKRSMKFASSASYASSSMDEEENENDGSASGRHHQRNANARRHNTSRSFLQPDSPFSNASRMHNNREAETRDGSRRNSPKSPTMTGPVTPTRKTETTDYDGDRADDEMAPLLGTVRQKPRYSPKRYTNLRHMDLYLDDTPRRSCSRCICCTIAILFGIIVVLAIVGFALLTTKPLQGVKISEIRNVLASEQEIMFDLVVKAVNPNIVSISSSHVDINIFARSKYVGSDKFWRDHGFPDPPDDDGDGDTDSKPSKNSTKPPTRRKKLRQRDNYLIPSDPNDDDDDDDDDKGSSEKATMLLGRIFEFDSGVEFAASPWQHHSSVSVGEMRLAKPGNKTETGGTERWEKVLEHPFELIVRGIMYYQLPLTTSRLTASLGASVLFKPDSAGKKYIPVTDDDGNIIILDPDHGWWP